NSSNEERNSYGSDASLGDAAPGSSPGAETPSALAVCGGSRGNPTEKPRSEGLPVEVSGRRGGHPGGDGNISDGADLAQPDGAVPRRGRPSLPSAHRVALMIPRHAVRHVGATKLLASTA